MLRHFSVQRRNRQPPVMTLPGKPVGAGRALTVGEKELAPPGPTAFSVGAGAFDGVAGALDSGDFVVSAGFSFSVAHADSAPIPTMATAPVASANRLAKRVDIIVSPLIPMPDDSGS